MHVPFTEHRHLLGTYLRPQRLRVLGLAVLLFGSIGLQLVNPQIIRYFLDTAQAAGPLRNLLWAAAAYILVGLLSRLLQLATTFSGLNLAWSATNALRTDLTAHLLRLDMPFHKKHTPGELIARVDGDVSGLADLFSTLVIKVIGNALLVLAILVLLYRESWGTGLALTIYVAFAVAALVGVQHIGVRAWTGAREASADLLGYLEERLAGTEDIRGVGAETHALTEFQRRLHTLLQKSRAGWMANTLGYVANNFLFIVGYGLGLAIGALLYTRGEVTIGTAFLIVSYIGMLAAPLEEIRWESQNLQQATAGVNRIGELLHLTPVVQERATAMLPQGALEVKFDHVSFQYEDEADGKGNGEHFSGNGRLVLREVDFTLAPRRVLGVLGRTGSGKTTVTRLLFRLYDPSDGCVALGGVDLRDVGFADLRARVGMVTQDVQLFGATLHENIALFDPAVGEAAIERALGELGLLNWVNAMPNGLETRLDAGGAGMSAGEAQLLAFTRILLRDPGLVILDEAASRLDPATEHRLEQAIDRLLIDRTAIIIAHRLSTVQRADDILILEAGRVVEFGPRARLAADPTSRFAGLLRTGLEEALA